MTPRYGVFGNFLNELLGAFLLPPLLQAIMDLFRLVCCKDGSDLLGIGGPPATSSAPRSFTMRRPCAGQTSTSIFAGPGPVLRKPCTTPQRMNSYAATSDVF